MNMKFTIKSIEESMRRGGYFIPEESECVAECRNMERGECLAQLTSDMMSTTREMCNAIGSKKGIALRDIIRSLTPTTHFRGSMNISPSPALLSARAINATFNSYRTIDSRYHSKSLREGLQVLFITYTKTLSQSSLHRKLTVSVGSYSTMDQDDTTKTPPQPYSHLTYTQYRSLILRETEAPYSSTLPLLTPVRGNIQRLSPDPNGSKDTPTRLAGKVDDQGTGEIPSYVCANCSAPLFSASAKFASGSGWPSFASALPGAIKTKTDWRVKEAGKWVLGGSLGVKFREEAVCKNCGGHLGHVFRGENWEGVEEEEQGKGVTRYCVNGSSLKVPESQNNEPEGTNLG
ncbi:hypothetical protein TWF694_003308 [Orbilia ellipsospora]|uniref:MsrB domain-containing protein n=1 Tax=Orbilia ellipsospora TaxID=2528407 RepID=A0AAV9X785_9PEZI